MVTPTPPPWDSPHVLMRRMRPKVLPRPMRGRCDGRGRREERRAWWERKAGVKVELDKGVTKADMMGREWGGVEDGEQAGDVGGRSGLAGGRAQMDMTWRAGEVMRDAGVVVVVL